MSFSYAAALKKEKKTSEPLVTTPVQDTANETNVHIDEQVQTEVPMEVPQQKVEPVTEPSICIPRLAPSFNDGQILDIIKEIELGEIDKIDLINKTDRNGDDYLMAFLHFASWNMEGNAKTVREQLMNDEKITVYYDDPKYLVLSRSYSPRHGTGEFRKKAVKNRKNTPATTSYVDENGETWFTKATKPSKTEKKKTQTRSPPPSSETKRTKLIGFSGLDIESGDDDDE